MTREYIQIEFRGINEELSGILIAELSEAGFYGFEEGQGFLKAFADKADYNSRALAEIQLRYGLLFEKTIIPETNWNKEWEDNFSPVIIDDLISIRADFHEPIAGVKHEIIITPKMSFGTGHHSTTRMMIRQMNEIEFAGKKVLDIGTGTAVLAILAEKSGASAITAIDNDEWSIQNAAENIQNNHCRLISILKSDSIIGLGKFDIILANINRNFILENLSSMKGQLLPGGLMILSGILEEDEEMVIALANELSLESHKKMKEGKWVSIGFSC